MYKSIIEETLKGCSSKEIAKLIKDESNFTKSIILSNINTTTASKVMEHFKTDDKIETTIRISNLRNVSMSITRNIALNLENKILALKNKEEVSGMQKMAEILTKMGPEGLKTLENVSMYDEKLAQELEQMMDLKKA